MYLLENEALKPLVRSTNRFRQCPVHRMNHLRISVKSKSLQCFIKFLYGN